MNCVYPVFVSSQQGLQGHRTRYDGIYNRSDRHPFLTALLKEHLQNQVWCNYVKKLEQNIIIQIQQKEQEF